MAFNQDDFIDIDQATFGKNGLCRALSLKWLSMQGTALQETFFTDLNTAEGREEVMEFSIQYERTFNPINSGKADATYGPDPKMPVDINTSIALTERHYMETLHARSLNIQTLEKLPLTVGTGKYIICVEEGEESHSVAVYIERSKGTFRLFDPNVGEFSFDTPGKIEDAIVELASAGSDEKFKLSDIISFKPWEFRPDGEQR